MFHENGAPRFKIIIEGANLFITQDARLILEEKGMRVFLFSLACALLFGLMDFNWISMCVSSFVCLAVWPLCCSFFIFPLFFFTYIFCFYFIYGTKNNLGVILYKDASANKGGVTSSSREVMAALSMPG